MFKKQKIVNIIAFFTVSVLGLVLVAFVINLVFGDSESVIQRGVSQLNRSEVYEAENSTDIQSPTEKLENNPNNTYIADKGENDEESTYVLGDDFTGRNIIRTEDIKRDNTRFGREEVAVVNKVQLLEESSEIDQAARTSTNTRHRDSYFIRSMDKDTRKWYEKYFEKMFDRFGYAPREYDSVDVSSEIFGYCKGMWMEQVCKVAWVSIEEQGLNPIAPHPDQMQFCGTEKGCFSNIAAVMKLLWCESRFTPDQYTAGYVQGTYNEARGIASIGNGWIHIATDEQAYDWVWSVDYIASDYKFSTKRWYPECGIDY